MDRYSSRVRATSPPGPRRWLFGPAPDLLLGCGLGYAVVFVAFWWLVVYAMDRRPCDVKL